MSYSHYMDVCQFYAALAEQDSPYPDDWVESRWATPFYVWCLLSPHPGTWRDFRHKVHG